MYSFAVRRVEVSIMSGGRSDGSCCGLMSCTEMRGNVLARFTWQSFDGVKTLNSLSE